MYAGGGASTHRDVHIKDRTESRNNPLHIFRRFLARMLRPLGQGKDSLLSKRYCKSWTAIWKEVKLDLYLTPHTKINPKWIKDLNGRTQNCKTLRRKHWKKALS